MTFLYRYQDGASVREERISALGKRGLAIIVRSAGIVQSAEC